MAVFNDFTQLNDCSNDGDWTTGGNNSPDSPKLNNSSSTVPYYIEGTSCMDFPLKSNADGYTYDGVTSFDVTGRVFVWWFWFPGPDVDGLPLNTFNFRLSSSSGFTSNFNEWDVKNFLAERPGSFVPIKVYPTNADVTTGSPDLTSVVSYGVVVATGGTDNKAAAFDNVFHIQYIGGHSETFTNTFFDRLIDDATNGAEAEVIGIYTRSGDFFQTSIDIAVGSDGASGRPSSTANTVVDETAKTLFFDNIEDDHKLGYVFYNPNGANECRFTLTRVVHFWNSQQSTDDVFTNPNNADWFRLDGCSFTNGGAVELPSHNSNRYTRNSTFTSCGEIDVGDHDFTGNVISNATVGAFYPVTGTLRAANNSYQNCTDGIRFTGTGPVTVTLDGDTFSGNTDDIRWDGTGQLTINATNGANPTTSRVTGGGTVVIQNAVNITVTAVDSSGTAIQSARVLAEASTGGALTPNQSISITRSGTTATVTQTAHGLATGDRVAIRGAVENEYNGKKTVTVTGVNTYTFTVTGSPGTPATGTLTARAILLEGTTNASGIVTDSFNFGGNQPITGRIRKSSTSPLYKTAPFSGTITSAGFSSTVTMIDDE